MNNLYTLLNNLIATIKIKNIALNVIYLNIRFTPFSLCNFTPGISVFVLTNELITKIRTEQVRGYFNNRH